MAQDIPFPIRAPEPAALPAVVPTALPVAVPTEAPKPPLGATPGFRTPAHGADGSYDTPNHGISPEQAGWHLRSALNVAALACRDEEEQRTVAKYNAMLTAEKDALAAMDQATRDQFRAKYGAAWQDRHDSAMTKVYNFFAQPPAHDRFCAVAKQVLDEVQAVEPSSFPSYAVDALARVEEPFVAFYRDYDAYQVAFAAWQGGGTVQVAAAAPTPAN